jgi:hypothetical protein
MPTARSKRLQADAKQTGHTTAGSAAAATQAHLCAHIKHGHDVWVTQPVVQQRLQAGARVKVTSHLLQHLDRNKAAVPVACGGGGGSSSSSSRNRCVAGKN